MKKVGGRIGLKGFCGVDSNGMSGGLALYWHASLDVDVMGKNERIIDAMVRVEPSAEQ